MSSETVTVTFRREVAETVVDSLPLDLDHMTDSMNGGHYTESAWEYEERLVEGGAAIQTALDSSVPAPVSEEAPDAA